MSVPMKRTAVTLLASLTVAGVFVSRSDAQVTRSGIPLFSPSVAKQSINPNFQIAPGLTLSQAAFNTAVTGNAIRRVPPYALGYNPYPLMAGYGPGYASIMPYMGGGIGYGGAYVTAGGYGYGGMLATAGYSGGSSGSGYSGGSMPSPYASSGANATLTAPYMPAPTATAPKIQGKLVEPAAGALLVSASRPEHPETTRDIWIYDNFFSPDTIVVRPGTTVRWINYGYHNHSVAAQDGDWDSGPMRRGAEYSITLDKPGTYQYLCRYHPDQMSAKIVVQK